MSRRKTLLNRMLDRDKVGLGTSAGKRYYTRQDHIRAELDRLSRKVRKHAHRDGYCPIWQGGYMTAIGDVLALIKEAKR